MEREWSFNCKLFINITLYVVLLDNKYYIKYV